MRTNTRGDDSAREKGWEAATLSMVQGMRSRWSMKDFNAGTEEYNRLTLAANNEDVCSDSPA